MTQALPKRPFLLRAMYQWITECGNTPHVIVDAGYEGAEVPRGYVKDGKIVLNLSEGATQHLRVIQGRGHTARLCLFFGISQEFAKLGRSERVPRPGYAGESPFH